MFETVIYQGEAQVVRLDENGKITNIVCKIPTFYTNDVEISKLISKLLTENSKKYKLEFEI